MQANLYPVNPYLHDKLAYDPMKDLALVSLLVSVPNVLLVRHSVNIQGRAQRGDGHSSVRCLQHLRRSRRIGRSHRFARRA